MQLCGCVSFFVVAGMFYYDRKKKSYSRLSGGLCCCVSFWFRREIGFGCTYYYVLGVPNSCGVVLVFLVLAGNSFWKNKVLVVYLAGARSLLRPKKKSSSRLSGGYMIAITTGKNNSSRLSGGCAITTTVYTGV